MDLRGFYSDNKSIQKSYNFKVSFFCNDIGNQNLPDGRRMPELEDFHVLNVTIPNWEFKKEIQYYGPFPRSFPVLDHDGFELTITLEEDAEGNVYRFIDWLQKRILMRDGTGRYNPPSKIRIDIDVHVLDDTSRIAYSYLFKNCFYLRASNPTYDYGTNEAIKYEIIFNCDVQNYLPDELE